MPRPNRPSGAAPAHPRDRYENSVGTDPGGRLHAGMHSSRDERPMADRITACRSVPTRRKPIRRLWRAPCLRVAFRRSQTRSGGQRLRFPPEAVPLPSATYPFRQISLALADLRLAGRSARNHPLWSDARPRGPDAGRVSGLPASHACGGYLSGPCRTLSTRAVQLHRCGPAARLACPDQGVQFQSCGITGRSATVGVAGEVDFPDFCGERLAHFPDLSPEGDGALEAER